MNKLSRSSLIFAGLLSLVSLGVNAQFIEGKDYAVISEAQPIKTGEKIEVREMFWYGCPHCYSFIEKKEMLTHLVIYRIFWPPMIWTPMTLKMHITPSW
jgi:hypothetical protein